MKECWVERNLGDLTTIKTGKLNSNAMVESGEYPFFTCSRKIFSIDKYAFDCEAILLAGNNASGDFNVKHYEGKFNAYQRTYVITINDEKELSYVYLKHKMEANLLNFKNQSLGANTRFLKVGMIKDMVIPIPLLSEQKQIVAILDEVFEAIDQAKANIEKNIENAKEFQISATNDLFNSIGDSEFLTIDEITDFITDYVANGSFASLKENVNYKSEKDYAVLLRLTDHSKKFKGDFVYVDKHSFDFLKKSTVYPNDIILSNVGARLGTAFRAPDLGMPMTLGPNAILIKAKKLGDYLFCWLQSAYGQKAIKSVVSGAGQPKFNKTQFKKIKVPIPKEEYARRTVVNKINIAESEFDKLYKNYLQKLESLDELKKSILQKAFSGELTQNPVTV